MGKKNINELSIISPKKNFLAEKPLIPSANQENVPVFLSQNANFGNMMPISNENKKAKTQGQSGTRHTEPNLEVEEQRNQTSINQFDISSITSHQANEDLRIEGANEIIGQRPDPINMNNRNDG